VLRRRGGDLNGPGRSGAPLGSDLPVLSQSPGRAVALSIGAGRLAVGLAFLAKPVESVRFLGLDTATATRIVWLAQMTAARDAALGIGTIASALSNQGTSAWLLAGAACDGVDAAAIAVAARSHRVALLPAIGVIAVAAGAVAAAVRTVQRQRSYRAG
jgi:hypothetical protein